MINQHFFTHVPDLYMKSQLLTFVLALASATALFAQGPKMARNNAIAAFQDYKLDVKRNFKSLEEAKTNIDIAAKDAELAADPKTWLYVGDIYLALQIDAVLSQKYTGVSGPMADAYLKMMQLDAKKKFKLEAENGFINGMGMLYNDGGTFYNAKDFAKAAEIFEKTILLADQFTAYMGKMTEADVDQKLREAYPGPEGKGAIAMMDIRYQAGVAHLSSGNMAAAEKHLNPLLSNPAVSDDRKIDIYIGLYNACKPNDPAKAKDLLAKGRQQFPSDQGLLVTEIQLAFEEGRAADLIVQVQKAVNNEPKNVSLRHALGSIYDELLQKANKEKNAADAAKYFDLARAEYLKIMEVRPDYSDAFYNLAVLYNNRAAEISKQLEEVSMKEYEAKSKELQPQIDANIGQALSYFDQCAKILMGKNDVQNVLPVYRAMLEIYAKTDETKYMELSKKVKELEGK
jgi:tetratricopeptide (TPR) repeat protein